MNANESLSNKEYRFSKGQSYFIAKEFVKAFDVLEKLLPCLNISLPEEKILAAKTLHWLGYSCNELALLTEAVNFCRTAAETYDDKQKIAEAMSSTVFISNGFENFSAADFRKLYDEYKSFLTDIVPFPPKIYAHKKIRVGFMSGDFLNHTVMRWCANLIVGLNKNFFATYCYSNGKDSDKLTNLIRNTVDGWRDIYDLTDEAAAKIIRDDEIDILFDLSGHTAYNRLRVAAYCPASVQISGVGYMNSTGLDCFDYFLSDKFCAGDDSYFVEKIIRLPHSHVCYIPPEAVKILDAPCRRKNFVTFGCFNQFCKFSDSILSAWKKILDRVPQSRLLLKNRVLSTADGRKFVAARLKNFDFDLSRVETQGYSKNFLEEYNEVDIALDTFPYVGGVTTCDSLWMGTPVISLYGDRHGTRFGLSILKNVRLDELAVANFDDYVERAVALANDAELISVLKKTLRGMMKSSPLMDSNIYVRDVEKVFAEVLLDAQKKFHV